MIIIFSTVLENFSGKPRNTVSVREGQAVVLLCGPPLHYGGTLFYSGSSHILLLVSAVFIAPHAAAFPPSALALLVFCLPTSFCHSSSGTRFHQIFLSIVVKKINTSFLSFFFSFCWHRCVDPHNLKFTFLICLICVHPASIKSPPPSSVDRLSLGNKSSWCGQRSVYPLTEWRVVPRVCVLLINRPSKRPALLQPLGVHQHNFTLAPQTPLCSLLPVESCSRLGFNTLAICPAAFPPSCL